MSTDDDLKDIREGRKYGKQASVPATPGRTEAEICNGVTFKLRELADALEVRTRPLRQCGIMEDSFRVLLRDVCNALDDTRMAIAVLQIHPASPILFPYVRAVLRAAYVVRQAALTARDAEPTDLAARDVIRDAVLGD
jgi:hypothetical protein